MKNQMLHEAFLNKTAAVEPSKPRRQKTTTDTKQSKKCYPESCGFLVKSGLRKPHKTNVGPLDTPNN